MLSENGRSLVYFLLLAAIFDKNMFVYSLNFKLREVIYKKYVPL